MNFKTDSFSVTVHYRSQDSPPKNTDGYVDPDLKIVVSGRFLYVYEPMFSAEPVQHQSPSWQKSPLPMNSKERSEVLSLFTPVGAFSIPDPGEIASFVDLGNPQIRGQQLIRYQYGASSCQTNTNDLTETYLPGSVALLVDQRDRIVKTEVSRTVLVSAPEQSIHNRSTSTVTTHLYDFGAPVNIAAPKSTVKGVPFVFERNNCL